MADDQSPRPSDHSRRLVSVTTEATVTAAADEAEFGVTIKTENNDLVATRESNDKRAATLMELAAKYGVDDKHVEVSKVSISFHFDKDQGLFVYRLDRELEIRMRDRGKIDRLLSDIIRQGGYSVGNITLSLSGEQEKKLQLKARRQAIQNAKEQASALAEAAGAKLGKVWSIQVTTDDQQKPFVTSVIPVVGSVDTGGTEAIAVASSNSKPALQPKENPEARPGVFRFVALAAENDQPAAATAAAALNTPQVSVSESVYVEFEIVD